MAKQAPDPIDVQDFQFILQCRLKIFTNEDSALFNKPCSLLAAASRFGLVFVGTGAHTFQVIQTSSIEKHAVKDGEIADYSSRTITLPSRPKHLSVNCDSTRLAVVAEKNDCPIGLIYEVASFLRREVSPPIEIRLSPTPNVSVLESSWNPTIPSIFTVCKNDGTMALYEFKETGIDINELPAESRASCMCWSPKGKQIAVGSQDGKITQYKPDLKAMKVISAPPLEGSPSVIALQWISNYQFIALYKSSFSDNTSLLVVDSPKTGSTVYTNYEDVCYSYGNVRPVQFYSILQPNWGVLMVASSNSMEVGVLGSQNDQWIVWILPDSARAELPMSSSKPKQETLPIGLVFDTAAVEPVIWGESTLPPAPYLLVLSHHGLLCCFKAINVKPGVPSICQSPEILADTSGLSEFKSAAVKVATPIVDQPKQIDTTAPLPKPAEAAPAPFSFSQPSKQSPTSVITNPPISQFTSASSFQVPKYKFASTSKPEPASLFAPPKTVMQPLFTTSAQQQPVAASIAVPTPIIKNVSSTPAAVVAPPPTILIPTIATIVTPTPSPQPNDQNAGPEEADLLFKLIREECDMLEAELKALLHKGRSLKIDLGSDDEAVALVHGVDALEDFLKEVNETSAGQVAEVHSLKQGLIQTWAWYEDARSRFVQTQDVALGTLLRIQKLDPVSQRYLADIRYMCYYLSSQTAQAHRALDEQWENFQDSCKNIVKMKVPTMEIIYQTMVHQNAIQQRQQYILKDISRRIRLQRSKATSSSLLISLNGVDQMAQELQRLQLEPQSLLQAQYDRVMRNQQNLTKGKVQKLSRALLSRDVVQVIPTQPKLPSATSAKQASSVTSKRDKALTDISLLKTGLSPIATGKVPQPKVVDFTQSTPKIEPKQSFAPAISMTKSAMPTVPASITVTTRAQASSTTSTIISLASTAPLQFKFTAIPSTTAPVQPTTVTFVSKQQSSIPTQISKPDSTAPGPTIVTKPTAEAPPNIITTSSSMKSETPFSSLFGTTKPTPTTFSFTLSTSSASQPTSVTSKSSGSVAASAFVPTTQLSFTFSNKASIGNVSAPLATAISSMTTSKAPTFVFGNTSSLFGPTATPTITSGQSTIKSTTVIATPSTATVTVVLSATTTAAPSLFNAFKTSPAPSPINLSVTTPASAPSLFQGFQKTTNVSELAAVPIPLVTKSTSEPSITSASNIAATTVQSSFSFVPKISQSSVIITTVAPSTVSITPISTTSIAATTTKVEKQQPSLFSATTTPFFGGASTVSLTSTTSSVTTTTSTNSSLFSATLPSTTTMESLFSNKVTSTTAPVTLTAAPVSIFAAAATATVTSSSIFKDTKSGSLFSSTTSIFEPTTVSTTSTSIFAPTTIPTSTSIFAPPTIPTASTSIFAPTTISTTSSSIFAPTAISTTSSSIFGAPPLAVATTTTDFLFSSTNAATSDTSIFKTPTVTTSTAVFGSTLATSILSGFGTVTTTSSIFTQPISTSSPFVAGSVFNATPKTTANLFSAPSFTSSFGTPVTTTSGFIFGQPTSFASGSVFGTPASTSSNFGPNFGASGASIFSTPNTAQQPTGFDQTQPSAFSFAAAAANIPNTNSTFGFSKPFGFGNTPTSTNASSFNFGNLNVGAATTTTNTGFGSGFGQPANANPFAKSNMQEQKPAFGGGSLFGTPTTTSASSIFGGGSSPGFGSSVFGSAPAPASAFGSAPAFGQQSAFGQNSFSSSFGNPSQPGPFSTGNQSVAQTGFGGFGQQAQKPGFGSAPVFGGSPSGFGAPPTFGSGSSPGFGTAPTFGSPPKLFGSPTAPTGAFGASPQQENPTFANLATQNTLGFGSLAQQTQSNPAMSSFSGGSSFSTWR